MACPPQGARTLAVHVGLAARAAWLMEVTQAERPAEEPLVAHPGQPVSRRPEFFLWQARLRTQQAWEAHPLAAEIPVLVEELERA